MNAYELADALDNKANTFTGTLLEDSATILRQQAKRIEELESEKIHNVLKASLLKSSKLVAKGRLQHKELSDEEILNILNAVKFEEMVTADDLFYMFARAIIKASRGEE